MKTINFVILSIFLASCIERFNPPDLVDTSGIAVTGIITDENPAEVYLEKPVRLYDDRRKVVGITDATISVFENDEFFETLAEDTAGVYKGNRIGLSGNTYHLEIELADARLIISTPQLLKPKSAKGTLSKEEARQYYIDQDGNSVPEYGVNINTYINSDTISQYYRWTFSGTYITIAPLDSTETPCYVPDYMKSYFAIGKSVSKESDILSQNIRFFSRHKKFFYGYSCEVTQLALNEDTYNYWKQIDDQQNQVGSIFDSTPDQIIGNLTYQTDNTPVPGFFEASSVRTQRIFIRPTDFEVPPTFVTVQCLPYNPPIDPVWCEDCSLYYTTSTRIKPSYWPD
ncbi:MAG: DUF4249 family protein [Cyclobacteriaceae bacterium]